MFIITSILFTVKLFWEIINIMKFLIKTNALIELFFGIFEEFSIQAKKNKKTLDICSDFLYNFIDCLKYGYNI